MSNKDSLGDRMKSYERAYISKRSMPFIPTIARLDGKAFHSWTKGLDKPFDRDFIEIMQRVTKRLVEESNAIVGYTQSDEISLIFNSDAIDSQIFFDGKLYKINSILASMCTAFFNEETRQQANKISLRDLTDRAFLFRSKPLAFFDCRVFQVPNKGEAINYLIWREQDATRNSIQSAGQANFSHNRLHKKTCNDIQEMLFQDKGINWNDYELFEKRGTYIVKTYSERPYSNEEIENLPPKHQAKSNPGLKVYRSLVDIVELPIMSKIKNRVEVIFEGYEPEIGEV